MESERDLREYFETGSSQEARRRVLGGWNVESLKKGQAEAGDGAFIFCLRKKQLCPEDTLA